MTARFIEYSGMSYEQASREANRLVKVFGWFKVFNRLTALKEIMDHNLRAAA
jgi:hypothetical protein